VAWTAGGLRALEHVEDGLRDVAGVHEGTVERSLYRHLFGQSVPLSQ